jgi:hypothetical protein
MNPLHIRQHLLPDMRTRVKIFFKVYGMGKCRCRYYKYPKCGVWECIIDLLYETYKGKNGWKRGESPHEKIFWQSGVSVIK